MLSNEMSVAVGVADANKSASWYAEKLGFETSVKGHWVTVNPKGSTTKIHLCQGEVEPGNTGIAIYTDDIQKTVADLTAKGVQFAMGYTKTEWGEMAQLKDPDGNVIWIKPGGP